MLYSIDNARVLVTGGAGFVGSHLCDQLAARGNEILVLDNFATGNRENLAHLDPQQVQIVEADIRKPAAIAPHFAGVDYVFHLAAANVRQSLTNLILTHETNTTGTLNVLQAATDAGVRGFLYCSSSEIYGNLPVSPLPDETCYDPTTMYGATKLAGEYYTRVFHRSNRLSCVIARPHNAYGPRAHYLGHSGEVIPRFILLALAGKPLPVFGDGQQTRDFTYVEETAECLVALLARPACRGTNVTICRGEAVSIRTLAEHILTITQSRSKIMYFESRPGDIQQLLGNATHLQAQLGRTPDIGIVAGLMKTVPWYTAKYEANGAMASHMITKNWLPG